MVKRIYIIGLVIALLLLAAIIIPLIDQTPETTNPFDDPVDITKEVETTYESVSSTTDPIKLIEKRDGEITKEIYTNGDDKRSISYRREDIVRYKVQDTSKVKIYDYKYSEPVSISTSTISLTNANVYQKVEKAEMINQMKRISRGHDLSTAAKVDENTYKISDGEGSTVEVIIKDGMVQQMSSPEETYMIKFDAETIEKPDDPEPNTDGQEEETDCSDLDHC